MATSNPPANDTGTTLDASSVRATTELYSAAIGPIGAAHYQKAFARMDSAERARGGWNWAAALVTLNWMIFRGLWGPALAYTGAITAAALLVFGIGRLAFQFTPELEAILLGAFALAAIVVPGLMGNRLAYKACQARVQSALAANATLPEACAMLKGQAVTRSRLIAQTVINAVLLSVASGLYMALPSMHNMPMGGERMTEARNVAVGRATDLAAKPAVAPASAPVTASAPSESASAPRTASLPVAAASAPAAAASAPSTPASAPTQAPVARTASANAPAAPVASKQAAPQANPGKPLPALAPSPAKAAVAAPSAKAASAPAKKTPATTPSAPVSPSPTAPTVPQYVINVGLFADPNNALNAYTRLQDAGLKVSTREVKSAKGMLSRIRVGPFETQVEAERAAEKIRELKLDAVIIQP